MDNKNVENWEKELKDKLGDHKEATGSKDLDVFMGKLDNNNFFKSKGISVSGKWAFVGGFVIAGVALWILSGEQPVTVEPEIPPVIEAQTIETKAVETVQVISEEIDTSFDTINAGGVAEINVSEDSISKVPIVDEQTLAREKIDLENKIERNKIVKKEVVEPNIEKKEVAANETVSKKVVDAVSDVDKPKEETKTEPVARKRIVIMTTDTTVVTDTTHVKHREKDLRKNK
jgi:hypothetical protein